MRANLIQFSQLGDCEWEGSEFIEISLAFETRELQFGGSAYLVVRGRQGACPLIKADESVSLCGWKVASRIVQRKK